MNQTRKKELADVVKRVMENHSKLVIMQNMVGKTASHPFYGQGEVVETYRNEDDDWRVKFHSKERDGIVDVPAGYPLEISSSSIENFDIDVVLGGPDNK